MRRKPGRQFESAMMINRRDFCNCSLSSNAVQWEKNVFKDLLLAQFLLELCKSIWCSPIMKKFMKDPCRRSSSAGKCGQWKLERCLRSKGTDGTALKRKDMFWGSADQKKEALLRLWQNLLYSIDVSSISDIPTRWFLQWNEKTVLSRQGKHH